jgi:hypothetical protein
MAEQTAKQRVQEKLRTFYEGLPEEERRIVAALVMPTDSDVRGFGEDGEYGATITVPNFDAVIATRLLEVPAFERVAALPDSVVDSVQPETSSTTVQFERNS